MDVTITVEVEDGLATVVDVVAPPGVIVRVKLCDYDTDGSDPDDLDVDENGRPCFASTSEYFALPEKPGFI
ncbi:MAG TPA: hypothetical protein VHU15_02870 [Stellaceae bacterium]|jgi:hypothetical protein|nr:hypothetical protein [Stellaceae bacterium]